LIQIRSQSPYSWSKQNKQITTFVQAYGDKRITIATLQALQKLTSEQLAVAEHNEFPSAAVVTASSQGKLLGVGFAIDDGSSSCLIVVHPTARRQGIGNQLLDTLIRSLKHFSCLVAVDNISSLSLCFKYGLHATSMHEGPTGKTTLRFERSLSNGSNNTRNLNTIFK